MKDGIKFIREAYLTLLQDAITYNGSAIPVFDEESDPTENDFYVIVSTVTDADIPNKAKFFNETTVLIDVVTRINFRLSQPKQIVDSITAKVLELVLPSVNSTGLANTADFQITNVRKESSQHLPMLDTSTKKIIRRVTRFSQTIIEK